MVVYVEERKRHIDESEVYALVVAVYAGYLYNHSGWVVY